MSTPVAAAVPSVHDSHEGDAIIVWGWRATGLLVAVLAIGVLSPSRVGLVVAAVSVVFFLAGVAAFLWSFAVGIRRSRTDDVSVAGLFLLSEGAPGRVRNQMRWSVATQCLAAVAAVAVRPFTALAFGLLAPLLGLGLMGVWSARYGVFRARQVAPKRGSSRPSTRRSPAAGSESATISVVSDGGEDA